MGLVIDTSALVALERSGGAPERWPDEPVVLPAIVLAELLTGQRMASTPQRAAARGAKIKALVDVVPLVEFGGETAEHWADLFAFLSARGAMIPANDLSVAATARQLGYGVLVGPDDEAHFRRIPNLRVETLEG